MRTLRLATTSLVRPTVVSTRGPTRAILGGRLPMRCDSSPTTASTSIRQLASAAIRTDHDGMGSAVTSTLRIGVHGQEALLLEVETVERLLRDGLGGSDVWIQRLQKVKEDLVIPRSRRIAGMFPTSWQTLMISCRRRHIRSERRRIFLVTRSYIRHVHQSPSFTGSTCRR